MTKKIQPKPHKHIPQRTCVGCGQVLGKREMVRVVRTTEGDVVVDPTGKLLGYRNLEALMAMRPASAADPVYNLRLRESLVEVQGRSLLRPYAEMMMSNLIETSSSHLAEKHTLNGNVMRFVPIGAIVYREACLLALSGELEAAKQQMERAIWSYPGDFPSELEKLRELALNDPAHFAALLEFALQKYEDRERAILSG